VDGKGDARLQGVEEFRMGDFADFSFGMLCGQRFDDALQNERARDDGMAGKVAGQTRVIQGKGDGGCVPRPQRLSCMNFVRLAREEKIAVIFSSSALS